MIKFRKGRLTKIIQSMVYIYLCEDEDYVYFEECKEELK